jgi:gas vesicle protein
MMDDAIDGLDVTPVDDVAETPPAAKPGGFVAGLFIGLLAGTVLAMIAAPQSGEETRDILRAKAREAADRTRDTAGDISQTVSGTTSDLIERGRSIVDQARARVDASIAEGIDAAEHHRNELDTR